jgi:PAS domain-containing protein
MNVQALKAGPSPAVANHFVKQQIDHPAAVFVIDKSGSITRANEAALQMLDLPESAVLGKYYGRFFALMDARPNDTGEWHFADPMVRCLATEEPYLNVLGLLLKSGTLREPFEGAVAPVYDEKREPAGAVLILQSGDS